MERNVEIIKTRNNLSDRTRGKVIDRLRVAAYCRVSTDSEDQLNSYKSQVQYYTTLIKKKSDWIFAGIYADEAITGTQVTKREDFQKLINDCVNGEIDMVITKSISRFARNTLDTLKYVRLLKDRNIAVFFEDEKINTLTMDGELLLVVLSSVAQQEVENISANVKKGLKMKMQRGELVGFQGCLGYDYHSDDKSITINEQEAEIVRYIFNRYIEGAGGMVISRELRNLGYKTKRGGTSWPETTVIGIIKNEKYKGDILMGKTFTVDPISKRRLENFGEEDKFYIRDHHEPIISEEVFEKAQEILQRRSKARSLREDGKREKFSRQYAFSCLLECGFCGSTLSRRSWHSGTQYNKIIWQCVAATKKGKKFCPDSKGIAEETIEQAFMESYRLLCAKDSDVLDEFLKRTEESLCDSNAAKQLAKIEKELHGIEIKRSKLVDMLLEEVIDKATYESKHLDLAAKAVQLENERKSLQETAKTEKDVKQRIAVFRKTLERHNVLETFDRYVFESIIEKVIVGGYDENGDKDPSMLTFIYKTGLKNKLDSREFKQPRKNGKAARELSSHDGNEVEKMSSYHGDDAHRDGRLSFKIGRSVYLLSVITDRKTGEETVSMYYVRPCSVCGRSVRTDTNSPSTAIYCERCRTARNDALFSGPNHQASESRSSIDVNAVKEMSGTVREMRKIVEDSLFTGKGEKRYADGGRYVGDFANGMRHGKGTYYFPNGERYEGDFANGIRHGKGTYYFNGGNRYEGDFDNGKMVGTGSYILTDGSYYTGQFVDGAYNGFGRFYDCNGALYYEGQWKNDCQYGQGTQYYQGGVTISGFFIDDDQLDGEAICAYPDGTRVKLIYEDGEVVDRITL